MQAQAERAAQPEVVRCRVPCATPRLPTGPAATAPCSTEGKWIRTDSSLCSLLLIQEPCMLGGTRRNNDLKNHGDRAGARKHGRWWGLRASLNELAKLLV